MGGAWEGLWVAVLPHKGLKGHKPASSQLQGNHKGLKPASSQPVGNAGELVRGSRALGLLSYQPQAEP